MPQSTPTPKDPRYAEALAALRRLAIRPPSSDGAAIAADRAVLEGAEADWRACVTTWSRYSRCPTCHRFGLSVLWGDEHVVACREHPAIKRSQRAESEWLAVSAVARALARAELPVVPPRTEWPAPTRHGHRPPERSGRPFVQIAYEREASEALATISQTTGREEGKDLSKQVKVLEDMLVEWGHYLDRARHPVPCPCCHELFEVRSLPMHVAGCRSHPDWRRAEALEAAVASLTHGADTGVGALVDDLDRTRLASCDLLAACWSVIDAFGYQEHGRSYLRHSDQEPFESAVRAADELLASADPDRIEP
jgi:hypothetical protein